ncbi:hypothetical protein [Lentzea albida]|uniref:hypothetical protein n=1 Tax=Lentzea albida TaxID=65499 RepID=UPI0031838F7C
MPRPLAESLPWAAIASMTRLRRSKALSGRVSGSSALGLLTMPASIAAWGTVSSAGVVPK